MPINPSIIGNVMAPQAVQMPDVNAMLQTQTRGMENVYQIETARQQQAKEEAAALKKEQEDAAVKALLPAYARGLQTGSVADAIDLVPPEMRGQLQPFIDALADKSPEEVRAALTGSLVTSEVGRAFLENQARMRTADIQQGQLDVSREDIKLRRQKQALDALGQGEWELKEGEGGFFWTNPRTRQVIPADVTGGAAPAVAAPGAVPGPTPIPAPDVVTPRMPETGVPAAEAPISAAQPPDQQPKFRPKPKEGAEKGLTEYQGKAAQHAANMEDANRVAQELEDQGVTVPDSFTNAVLGTIRSLPIGSSAENIANGVESILNQYAPSLTPEEQRLARAQILFITAVLRSESGAEIKTSEFPAEYRKYFPLAGDEKNEKLIAEKRRSRRIKTRMMRESAGEKGSEMVGRVLEEESGGVPNTAPAAPGETFEGIKFLGVKEGP